MIYSEKSICGVLFWIACAGWILPEVFAWRLRRSADVSKSRDHGSLTLVITLWLTGIALDIALTLLAPQAIIIHSSALLIRAGIGLMFAGILLRWYSAHILGKYFTFDVAIASEHKLIEEGPYRFIRHPSYTGALITVAGFGLALSNWAGLLAIVSCLSLAYAYRIPVEEAELTAAMGTSYREYVSRTWRLIPFVF